MTARPKFQEPTSPEPADHDRADLAPGYDPLTPEQRAGLEEARAELADGLFVPGEEVEAWMDSWGTENELPPPKPRPMPDLILK